MIDHWKKINADKVAAIIDLKELKAESIALLGADMWPEKFIDELSVADRWVDAIKVLAHALPRREAVWWACMCATQVESLAAEPEEQAALESAEKWVFKPTDEHRLDAFQRAQKSRSSSLGTMCALAAAFSQEKLPIAKDQEIEVDIAEFPKLISGTIVMAASMRDKAEFNEWLQNFLASGTNIACGGNGVIEKKAG